MNNLTKDDFSVNFSSGYSFQFPAYILSLDCKEDHCSSWNLNMPRGGHELNFGQSFLKVNVKKKIYSKHSSRFDFKYWILNTASLSS